MIPDGMIHGTYETMTDIMTGAGLNLRGGRPVVRGTRHAFLLVQEEVRYAGCEYQSVRVR